MDINEIEEFDKQKTKVLRYILYRKRTEYEVRQKFSKDIEKDRLEEIIEVLKENNYINDNEYIKSAIKEQINLNTLSIKEIKYKMMIKGLKSDIIEEYIQENEEEMQEYELLSVKKIISKKIRNIDIENDEEIEKLRIYLLKKGYKRKNIEEAMNER